MSNIQKIAFIDRLALIALSLFVLFTFTNNHIAFFISEYFILLLLFIACGIYKVLIKKTFIFTYFNLSVILLFIYLIFLSALYWLDVDYGTLLSYCVWFLVLFFIPNIRVNEKSINMLLNSFVLSSLIISLLIIIFPHQYLGTGRYTLKLGNNTAIDPNYLGCFLYTGLSFCFFFLLKGYSSNRKKYKIIYSLISIVITYSIFLTGSRAAYFCTFIVFIGFILQLLKRQSFQKKIVVFLLLIVFLFSAIYFVVNTLPANLLSRFGFSTLNDGSNRLRVEHWKAALNAILFRPFGYSASHTMHILSTYTPHSSDAHNTYLTFFLQFGVIGFFVLLITFFRLVKPIIKGKNLFWISFVLAFLLNSFIIANHLGISYWISVIIIYYLNDKEISAAFM